MTDRLRIGTRGSPLALAQTELVVAALRRRRAGTECEIVPLRTSGDRTRRTTGTLDFTDEIDRRLEHGEIDAAVHSTKDLPAVPSRRVTVAAYLRRDDPRDCLVLRRGVTLRTLPPRARIGSSSGRRRAQLLAYRPEVTVVPIRGNVGTRIDQILPRKLDGVILAAAGLHRLGLADRISEYLPLPRWLPAPGQGAIAVATRADDRPTLRAFATVDHPTTRAAVGAERAVVAALGGDCDLPLGALATVHAGRVMLDAALWSPDGRRSLRVRGTGPASRGVAVGFRVGRRLAPHRDAILTGRRPTGGR